MDYHKFVEFEGKRQYIKIMVVQVIDMESQVSRIFLLFFLAGIIRLTF